MPDHELREQLIEARNAELLRLTTDVTDFDASRWYSAAIEALGAPRGIPAIDEHAERVKRLRHAQRKAVEDPRAGIPRPE
jgi:hypothetical protein